MGSGTVLNVGFDDTDSPIGMCTTFLAYKIAGSLCGVSADAPGLRGSRRAAAKFLDYPRLVRLNPNVPWKTRGNGAVSMRIRTAGDPQPVKDAIVEAVFRYADIKNGANPGLVFLEGDAIPDAIRSFGRLALWQLVGRGDARRLAQESGLDFHYMGNGQGLVGAIGAVGYEWDDHTLELLSYRGAAARGTPRVVSAASVRGMQDRTAPRTFNSFDEARGRVLITPRGPDPVFYGIRGESAAPLVDASRMIRSDERPCGYMIFRTNQGTGAHLRNELTPDAMRPYASGWVRGTVAARPVMQRGGHVFFEVEAYGATDTTATAGTTVRCAVYKPTGIAGIARGLMPGDVLRVAGGIRKASRSNPRVLNVEYIGVEELARDVYAANPPCRVCKKSMKSKGVGQGYECARCDGQRAGSKIERERPRAIRRGLYIPDVSAQRHLARPVQRLGMCNSDMAFDGTASSWLRVYYKDSGE